LISNKPTSFGTWYALQFQAVTAIVLVDSRLDPSAATGLLNNFREEVELNFYEVCTEPSSVELDQVEVYKVLARLVKEYGSEYNKVETPSIDKKASIDNIDIGNEKMENSIQGESLAIKDDPELPGLATRPIKSAGAIYAQKRNDRLLREKVKKRKRIAIGVIIAILILIAIALLIII